MEDLPFSPIETRAERQENRLFRHMVTTAMRGGLDMAAVMAQYFAAGDDGTVVWWMTSHAPVRKRTPFLPGSVDLVDGSGHQIRIADPWGGREPQKVDAHAARGGENHVNFRLELML